MNTSKVTALCAEASSLELTLLAITACQETNTDIKVAGHTVNSNSPFITDLKKLCTTHINLISNEIIENCSEDS